MTIPTIHMNGTSMESLVADMLIAYTALGDAVSSMKTSGPNGRDYYPQGPDAINQAVKEHWDRIRRVEDVRVELEQWLIAVQDGGKTP